MQKVPRVTRPLLGCRDEIEWIWKKVPAWNVCKKSSTCADSKFMCWGLVLKLTTANHRIWNVRLSAIDWGMNSTWRPNPNAKPFLPSSAYYNVPLPCKRTPLRIQKKGIVSRFIQGILVLVLCITVVVNVIFILDTTSKLRDAKQENSPLDQIRSQLREAEAETNVGPGMSFELFIVLLSVA